MAGAKVYAITSDSQYGKARDIEEFTYNFAEFCEVRDKIKVIFEKQKEIIREANIITNLGFVRPIDKKFIEMMNEKAVVPYMCEAWEYVNPKISQFLPLMKIIQGWKFLIFVEIFV